MSNDFFSDLLASISERGRSLLWRTQVLEHDGGDVDHLIALCDALLSGRGEASGMAIAHEILDGYRLLDTEGRIAFFGSLARNYGPNTDRLKMALENWSNAPDSPDATDLHFASEPQRQELFRRLNRAPGATHQLVSMRADLLDLKNEHKDLAILDRDLVHLLSSWFNRGFLVLRRIDWSTPATCWKKSYATKPSMKFAAGTTCGVASILLTDAAMLFSILH